MMLCLLLMLCSVQVFAADSSRQFLFELSADGKTEKQVSTGDTVTVSFSLKRTDSAEDYTMYAMQDEILYDGSFFELDESSIMTAQGLTATDLVLRDGSHALYINFVSMTGGDTWKADTMAGTFRLKVIGTSGSSAVRSSNHLVSTKDGQDSYEATAQDVTFVISSDCTVHFETNGGSAVPCRRVRKGGKLSGMAVPHKDGSVFDGWYRDQACTRRWNAETDTVNRNMTLYARWQ